MFGAAPSWGTCKVRGIVAGGLARIADRLTLPLEMKPSLGQHGRLSAKTVQACGHWQEF
jgi:hypothetical protein